MFNIVFVTLFVIGVSGTLTQNGVVTADSIDLNSNYGLDGLIDNKLVAFPIPGQHQCALTDPVPTSNASTWLSVNLVMLSRVETVIIINDESCCDTRIWTTDLSVGFDPLPTLNTPCSANPTRSGVYSCGGLSGTYLGIFKPGTDKLGICQIRAYSWQPNQSPFVLASSSTAYGSKEQLLTFAGKIIGPDNPFVTYINPAFWSLTFGTGSAGVRFIQVVVIIGHEWNDFIETTGWKLFYLDQTGIEVLAASDSSSLDKYGKEIVIQKFGTGIVLRKDVQPLSLFYVAVFTTITDCSKPSSFTWDVPASPVRVPVKTQKSVAVSALVNGGDCPVAYQLKIDNLVEMPFFITFDTKTSTIQIDPTLASHAGLYDLTINAVLNDGVTTPIVYIKSISIEVVVCTELTMDPVTAFTDKKFIIEANPPQPTQEFPLPVFLPTPTDAVVHLQYTWTDLFLPFITIVGDKVQVDLTTAIDSSQMLQIKVQDMISGTAVPFTITVTFVSCTPKNFQVVNPLVTIYTSRPDTLVLTSFGPLELLCGDYEIVAVNTPPQLVGVVKTSGMGVLVGASYGATLGTYSLDIEMRRIAEPSASAITSTQVQILACVQSVAMSPISDKKLIAGDTAKTFTVVLQNRFDYCIEDITYSLTYQYGPPLPTWISITSATADSCKITRQNASLTDVMIGPTFNFTVHSFGTNSSKTATTNFKVTLLDCSLKNLTVTPTAIQVRQLGPPVVLTLSVTALDPLCVVSTSFSLPVGDKLNVIFSSATPDSAAIVYSLSTDLTEPLGVVLVPFVLTLVPQPGYTTSVLLPVTVAICQVTSFTSPPDVSSAYNYYVIGAAMKTFTIPAFFFAPACIETVAYEMTSSSPFVTPDLALSRFKVQGTDLTQGQFTVSVKATTSVTLFQWIHTLTVTTIDCTPKNFAATPSTITTSQLGPSVTSQLLWDTPLAECGTNTVRIVTSPAPPALNLQSKALTFAPTLAESIGVLPMTIRVTNDLAKFSTDLILTLTTLQCQLVSLSPNGQLKLPSKFIVGGPELIVQMPQFTQTPECDYVGSFSDTVDNFLITQKAGEWYLKAKIKDIGPKLIRPRYTYKEDPLFADLAQSQIVLANIQCSSLAPVIYTIQQKGKAAVLIVSLIDSKALIMSADLTASQLQIDVNQASGSSLPTWIIFDSKKLAFTIQTSDTILQGDFIFDIAVSAPAIHAGWSCSISNWKVTLNLGPPATQVVTLANQLVLLPALVDQEVYPGDVWSHSIPTPAYLFVPTNPSKIDMTIVTSSPDIFVNQSKGLLILMKTLTDTDMGRTITVTYSLSDGTMNAEYKQKISFKNLPPPSPPPPELVPDEPQEPTPTFDPSTLWQAAEKPKPTQVVANIPQGDPKRPLTFKIKQISGTGLIFVWFSEPLVVPKDLFSKPTNSTSRVLAASWIDEAIEVKLIPGAESNVSELTYSWSVQGFTENDLTIQLNFENAKYVSAHQDLDSVQVFILNPDFFVAQSGARLAKSIAMQYQLPRQMDPDSVDVKIANAATSGAQGLNSLVIGNVIMSTVLSASLSSLFSMVEAQQLVCVISCSQISLPPLPAVLVSQFFQIANFDILNVGYVYNKIFYMPAADALSPNFAAVGFGDTYFVNNLGSVILSILGFLFLQALTMIFKRFKKKSEYIKSKWESLQPVCFWNLPIRVMLSSYSILVLAAVMKLGLPTWVYPGPKIDTVGAIIGIALTIIFPLATLYLMLRYFQDFEDKQIKQKYGSLYEGLDTKNKWIIAYRVWFLVRRLLLALVVVFIDKLTFQFCIWFAQSILSLVILGFGYPFQLRSEWRGELWNEVFILSTIYFIMFFSPYIADIDVFNGIGYCFCGLLFFHLLVNIVIIGYETVTEKRKQFRKWLIIRRELKKVKKLRTSTIRDQLRQEKQKFVKRRISVWNKDQNDLIMNLQRSETRRRSMALILDDEDEKNKKRLFAMKLAGNNRRRLLAQLDAIEESEEQQSSDTESVSSSARNQIQQAKNDSKTLNEIEEEEMVRVKPFMKTAKKQRSNAKQDGIEDIYIDKSLTIAKEIPFDEEKVNELEEWYSKRLNKFREKHGVKAKSFSPMKYKLSLGNLLDHIQDERTQLYNSTIEEEEEKGVTKRPQRETNATHQSAEATKEPIEETKEGPSELKNPVNANFKDLGKQQKVFKRQITRKQTFKALNTKAQTSRNQTNNSPDLKRKITLKETIKQPITHQDSSKLDSHPAKVEPRPKPVMTFRNLRQSKTFREKCENVGFKPVQYKLDEMLENFQKERTQDYETTLEEEDSSWDVTGNHKNALVDIKTYPEMKEDVNDRELQINVEEMQVEQAEESKSPETSSRVINILKNIQCANFEEPGKQQMLFKRNFTRIQPFKTQDSLPEIIKPNPAQSHRWFDKQNTLFLPQVVSRNALPMSGLAISQLGPSIRQMNSQTSRNKQKELTRPNNTVDKIRNQRLQLNSSKESLNLIDSTPDAIAVYQPAPPRKGRKLVLPSQLTHQIARKMRQKEKLSRSLEVQTERTQDRDKWYEQKSLTRRKI